MSFFVNKKPVLQSTAALIPKDLKPSCCLSYNSGQIEDCPCLLYFILFLLLFFFTRLAFSDSCDKKFFRERVCSTTQVVCDLEGRLCFRKERPSLLYESIIGKVQNEPEKQSYVQDVLCVEVMKSESLSCIWFYATQLAHLLNTQSRFGALLSKSFRTHQILSH